MNCPVCDDARLREVEKNGILIDVCPSCKGVWLDRGELDKLMGDVREVRDSYNQWHYRDDDDDDDDDRRRRAQGGYPPPASGQQQGYGNPNYGQGYDKHGGYGTHRKKKKKSVLDMFGDLFD
ncbi:zf-TFIIB domain-containing protein [Paenibacillus sp. GCM10023250]|uniref:TFIIB-type zinc ribbon-containing protein n=1 Tax=Paenibacillus sp. GCM10023250 TaxID=3252648 RepID=UPI00360A8998